MKLKVPAIHFPRTSRAAAPAHASASEGRTGKIVIIALAVLALAIGIGGTVISLSGPGPAQYTAYFSGAVGVYPGSNVDVLGVRVGTIDSVQPQGSDVKVVMSVDRSVTIPAGADAVVIVPSVIADRYIQLTPAYTGGTTLASGGVIPLSRTATPVEIDQIYSAIAKLAGDLGPNGVNKHGALSDVLNTGAANLKGNGQSLATLISQMSQLAQTLNGTQDSFFGTITNLQKFAQLLQSNNGQVKTAQAQLAEVSGFLAADRSNLAAALSDLATALGQVQSFISANRAGLKTNITNLEGITTILVKERASLAEALKNEPLAADNFIAAYDPATGTLTARGDLNELSTGSCSYITNPDQKGCLLPIPVTGSPSAGSGS